MPTQAATTALGAATHGHILDGLVGLIPAALVFLVIAAAGYLLKCWFFPFTTCRHDNPVRQWRCRLCQGTGRRLRTGRRLLNHIRSTRRR